MVRKSYGRHITTRSHHTLLTTCWAADVEMLEKGIDQFAAPAGPANEYHVALFEMAGDPQLHVNVTHVHQTRPVRGWAGPGMSDVGFVHNRMFDTAPTAMILRHIRQMVFAARV